MKLIFIILFLVIGYFGRVLWFGLGRTEKKLMHQNQVPTPPRTGEFSYGKLLRETIFPSNKHRSPPKPIPSVATPLNTLGLSEPSIIWFGHSSYLLVLNGLTVLVDPVLSGSSAPLSFMYRSFAGSDPYRAEDLPEIDVMVITHDHYDHLDYETVKKIRSKVKYVVTATGVGDHLHFWGYDAAKITELAWHESVELNGLSFTATPARHFSGRGLRQNNTLWAAFVLKASTYSIYIGGDSGYGPHFKETGAQYGPFDLAMLESGQYSEDWRHIHMMPEETVQAAQDLNAAVLFPVHWGKFALSLHDWNEPIARLVNAAVIKQQRLITPKIGQVTYLSDMNNNVPWWLEVAPEFDVQT